MDGEEKAEYRNEWDEVNKPVFSSSYKWIIKRKRHSFSHPNKQNATNNN